MAGAGFAGSLAAIALPSSANAAEIAAVLAVGALALLAGHGWGLPVVVAADVVLLGKIWPLVLYPWLDTPAMAYASGAHPVVVHAALLGALPGLWVLPRAVPGMIDILAGPRLTPVMRGAASVTIGLLGAVYLVLPAV